MRLPDRAARATTALGALTTTVLLAGPAAPAPAATAKAAPAAPVSLSIADRSLRYGQRAVVRGRVASGRPGLAVALEHRTRRGAWAVVSRGVTGPRGAFRLLGGVARSGLLRVSVPTAASASGAGAVPVASRERGVRVSAAVHVRSRERTVRAGRLVRVSGRVRPGTAGRIVVLERRAGRGWRRLARTRTRAGGRWTVRWRARSSFTARIRVRAAGTPALAAGRARAGRLSVLRPALASWYGSGGGLACGGRLTPGLMAVAHKSLPCGTMVTIRYRGRQVRVPVRDRGPFAGAREFDLGPGVRSALGFEGVGTVWVATG